MRPTAIEPRNLRFATDGDVPRYWHGGRKSVTAFFDNLSVFFPVGERFFIAAVRAHDRAVREPELRADVQAFFAQEAFHGREHRRYNERLARQGYPVEAMERRVEAILRAVARLPPRLQLGATCALEHFTSLLGHVILEHPRLLEGADPQMAALWRWHSAEENEHRAVAFDVFLAAGGTYPERVATMLGASVIFWAKVLEHQARMMHADGLLFSAREWGALLRFLTVGPGGLLGLTGHYLAYYRLGFHPLDIACEPLVERWRSEPAAQQVGRAAVGPEREASSPSA